jgi:hypothetical protein
MRAKLRPLDGASTCCGDDRQTEALRLETLRLGSSAHDAAREHREAKVSQEVSACSIIPSFSGETFSPWGIRELKQAICGLSGVAGKLGGELADLGFGQTGFKGART